MTHSHAAAAVVAGGFLLFAAQACSPAGSPEGDDVTLGAVATLGDGTVSSFVRFDPDDAPQAIGVVFDSAALASLPTERTDEHHCFDVDADGTIEPDSECLPTHERVLPLPPEATRRDDIPFK